MKRLLTSILLALSLVITGGVTASAAEPSVSITQVSAECDADFAGYVTYDVRWVQTDVDTVRLSIIMESENGDLRDLEDRTLTDYSGWQGLRQAAPGESGFVRFTFFNEDSTAVLAAEVLPYECAGTPPPPSTVEVAPDFGAYCTVGLEGDYLGGDQCSVTPSEGDVVSTPGGKRWEFDELPPGLRKVIDRGGNPGLPMAQPNAVTMLPDDVCLYEYGESLVEVANGVCVIQNI